MGTVYFEKEPCYPIDTVFYILPSDEFNLRFMSYLITQINFARLNNDTAVPGLNRNAAYAEAINLPPPPTQRKIAAILSAYDDLIENNTRRVQVLEQMARALYREWFVEHRFPGHEDAEWVEDEAGRRPKGWRVVPVSALATYVNGFAFKPYHWGKQGWPIIKIKELKAGVIPVTPRCSPDVVNPLLRINRGDILFSWSADLNVYIWADKPGLLNQHIFHVVPESDIPKEYLFHTLEQVMPRFRALSLGTTMQHIKRSALDEVLVTLPPQDLRLEFAKLVESLCQEVLNLTQRNANLRKTRDLLLPRLISGELDVSELEVAGPPSTQENP